MWLPATFDDFVASTAIVDQGTFCVDNSNTKLRIDYVAVSDSIRAKPASSRVMHDIDIRGTNDDHLLAAVAILCPKRGQDAPFRLRKVRYNRGKPKLKPYSSDYANSLKKLPFIEYATEPTTQHFRLTTGIEVTRTPPSRSASQEGLR